MKKKMCSLLIAICLFAFVLLSFAACASSDLKYEAMYGDDSYWWSVSGSYGDSTVKIPKKHNGVAVHFKLGFFRRRKFKKGHYTEYNRQHRWICF